MINLALNPNYHSVRVAFHPSMDPHSLLFPGALSTTRISQIARASPCGFSWTTISGDPQPMRTMVLLCGVMRSLSPRAPTYLISSTSDVHIGHCTNTKSIGSSLLVSVHHDRLVSSWRSHSLLFVYALSATRISQMVRASPRGLSCTTK